MKHNYKKIATIFIILDVFLFALLGFLFKSSLVFIVPFLLKVLIHLLVLRKEQLKPVLIIDGILACLPLLAIIGPILVQLFVSSGNIFVASWVVLIFGIYASPMTIVYGGILLTFGILSLRDRYRDTINGHQNDEL
ncbi:hypothetical protein IGI37_003192 [Enterococcus sp. AZ194]|uniref:hypothetical protein n=1 Tax=Enterococcus sp. AZ194 TaxID=2774629 RepID=UPI003F24AC3D